MSESDMAHIDDDEGMDLKNVVSEDDIVSHQVLNLLLNFKAIFLKP